MYRAPTSQSGAPGIVMLIVLVWGVIYVTGCTDLPTDPSFDEGFGAFHRDRPLARET